MRHNIEMTLAGLCFGSAKKFGKHIAFEVFRQDKIYGLVSYRLMGIRVQQFALLLQKLGVKRGDRVLLLSENRSEWPLAWFGTALAGAISIPLEEEPSPFLLKNIIENNSPAAIFVSRQLYPKLGDYALSIPVIFIDSISENSDHKGHKAADRFITDETHISVSRNGKEIDMPLGKTEVPEDFPTLDSDVPGHFPVTKADDPAVIYYSGTGPENIKSLELSSRDLIQRACSAKTRLFSRDRLLSTISLANIFECTQGLLRAVASGAMTIYLDGPPFPKKLISAARALKPTIILTHPRLVREFRSDFIEPALKKDPLYRYPITRTLAYKRAGKKMLSALGKLVRSLEIDGALPEDTEIFLRKIRFPVEVS